MAIALKVTADVREIERDLTNLQKRVVPRLSSQALNRAASKSRTAAIRRISSEKQIKQKLIRQRFRFRRASPKTQTAFIFATLFGVKVAKLGTPRQTSRGARVGRRSFPGAFVATNNRGSIDVFKRKGRARLPIKSITVPLNPEADQIARTVINTVGGKEYVNELERLLRVKFAFR